MSVYTILEQLSFYWSVQLYVGFLGYQSQASGRDDLSESEGQGRGNASDHYLVVLTSELNISAYNWNFAFCFISYPPNFIQICKIFF